MSGGSLDYLYSKQVSDLFHEQENLERAFKALSDLGYSDAAQEVETFSTLLRRASNQLEARWRLIQGLMHDVEWYLSCDYNKDTLEESIKEWRNQ